MRVAEPDTLLAKLLLELFERAAGIFLLQGPPLTIGKAGGKGYKSEYTNINANSIILITLLHSLKS
jgi:hypothetical protein